jgi:hypothetical protein
MFPHFNFRALFGVLVGVVAIIVGLLSPVRGHWDVPVAGVAGLSVTVPAAVPAMILTGFQAPPAVRRGPEELRLAPGAWADLDSRSADWGAAACAERCDLYLNDQGGGVEETGSGELADKSAAYYSCLAATDYGFAITPDLAEPGAEACSRTSDGRHAGMTVTRVEKTGDRVSLIVATVTVWEAPPVTVLRNEDPDPPLFQDLPGDW